MYSRRNRIGGSSSLILDANGLTKRGNFSGTVLYGSVSGKFSAVTLIHNPLGLTTKLKYRSTERDVDLG